ncbi:unnamed protein product [Schistocephalus solidus]|uniref:Uncharacterized protein n=1 Tax=Schistocephalus solidus TaxID=70667 RepID=A0A183T414_SCHSO|nr:unnamed protein product [Schistocephalus solidus]
MSQLPRTRQPLRQSHFSTKEKGVVWWDSFPDKKTPGCRELTVRKPLVLISPQRPHDQSLISESHGDVPATVRLPVRGKSVHLLIHLIYFYAFKEAFDLSDSNYLHEDQRGNTTQRFSANNPDPVILVALLHHRTWHRGIVTLAGTPCANSCSHASVEGWFFGTQAGVICQQHKTQWPEVGLISSTGWRLRGLEAKCAQMKATTIGRGASYELRRVAADAALNTPVIVGGGVVFDPRSAFLNSFSRWF